MITGSLYDMNGNLNNWWSEESYKNFNNKAQCFIEQYESYKVPNTDFKVRNKKKWYCDVLCCEFHSPLKYSVINFEYRQISESGRNGNFGN